MDTDGKLYLLISSCVLQVVLNSRKPSLSIYFIRQKRHLFKVLQFVCAQVP